MKAGEWPPLYHWSPRERRASIERYGLRPAMRSSDRELSWRAPYVCLAENADWAWRLSGGARGVEASGAWDLWQVTLGTGHTITWRTNDEVRLDRKFYEWRVWDRIYKRGVVWVAER